MTLGDFVEALSSDLQSGSLSIFQVELVQLVACLARAEFGQKF